MGCSGYVYGLSVVASMLSAGHMKKALLLTGEIPLPNISYRDKSTYPLFGDAGAATAIEFSDSATDIYFNLQTDGSGYKAIHIPDGGMRNYPKPETSFKPEKINDGIIRNRAQIALDGMAVFNFTLREVRPNVKDLLKLSGCEIADVDFFVFHQANRLMNETIRKQLKIDPEKYPYSIDRFGNTSSVSIPLTMVTEIREEIRNSNQKLLLSGFGVGLSWGSCIIDTDHIVCSELIEV
jgi:3-oxoacyl-[acyl-carrier-protein] synthase-3